MKFDLLPILNADGRRLPLNLELDFAGREEQGARFLTPVSVTGEFVNIGGSIELEAAASCIMEYSCDRCCETFKSDFSCSFKEIFKKEDSRVEDAQNPDAVVLKGTEIEIDEIVLANVLVNLPTKRLCHEDCKGLCPNCGNNLNQSSCNCDTRPADPRFDILDKLL